MNSIFKYVALGLTVFETVTALIPQVKNPSALNPAIVWQEIESALLAISLATGIKINMDLAQKITTDAVDTIHAALVKAA
jgi:hypothetical protein